MSSSSQEKFGLVVPLVLWGSRPPQNHITHITCVNRGTTIITGASDGHIVQWTVDETLGGVQPQLIMLAHDTAISCVSPASPQSSTTRYVSCSQDGQICLWDAIGGRAIDNTMQQHVHRKIIPYSNSLPDQHTSTRLFCIGDYADVIVMDAQDLNILYFFRSQLEPDWISALTAVKPYDKPVVIGVSVSGILKLWSIENLERRELSSVIYEEESRPLNIKEVRAISCSRYNTRMMLVISPKSWQVLDPCSLQQLIVSQCAIEAVNGTIISIDKVAIGFADSTVVLFQLPRNRLCGRQIRDCFGEKPTPIGSIEHPFVFALLRGLQPEQTRPFLECQTNFYFDENVAEGETRKIAYRVDHQGTLSTWKLPQSYDVLVDEFVRTRKPTLYESSTKNSFSDVWQRLKPTPPSIIARDSDRTITATIFVGCQGKLLLGQDDGSIIMTYACHTIAAQLLDMPSGDVQQRILYGHTAAVNCFLYPFEENQRYDPELFLSGGVDFAVLVWNIVSGVKLHRFCAQGGPILRMMVPPNNCNPSILNCICSIAGDNSAALLNLKTSTCSLLASRQQYPISEVKWRPLDDFMLLKCEDNSVYVWQMETGNLDRVVAGILSVDVLEACDEQAGLAEYADEAGASQAVQMLRAIKHKNVAAVSADSFKGDFSGKTVALQIRKVAAGDENQKTLLANDSSILPPPMDVVQLKKCSNDSHLILFNIDALITGLQVMDQELQSAASANELNAATRTVFTSPTASRKADGEQSGATLANGRINGPAIAQRWQIESNLYVDTARLLISLLHAWNLDENLDYTCRNSLKFCQPKVPLCFGSISRRGFISLYTPYCSGKMSEYGDQTFRTFSQNIRWTLDRTLTTLHLLALVAVSNTMMSLRSRLLHYTERQRPPLKRLPSLLGRDAHASDQETQAIRQAWSHLATMHSVLLPETIKPAQTYASPQIELLARRWQDSSAEIRDAAQALLISELERMGAAGRHQLLNYWSTFLPVFLDPALSIFGQRASITAHGVPSLSTTPQSFIPNHHQTLPPPIPPLPSAASSTASSAAASSNHHEAAAAPPPRPAPPIPPRQRGGATELPKLSISTSLANEPSVSNEAQSGTSADGAKQGGSGEFGGLHQVRRNQATSIIVLGVFGAAFARDLAQQSDLTRAISHALVELLVSEETPLLPLYSPLRRAAVDLIGRGFVEWQPHIDVSKTLMALLELTSVSERSDGAERAIVSHYTITPEADASRTARHALALIASTRAQTLISALSMEVARYNAAAQHQTMQNPVSSPLLKARLEVLHLLEVLAEKQYIDVADMITSVGQILIHCIDTTQLKNRSLTDIFPPAAKFFMIGYCPSTKRVAFGGKDGAIVVHDLRTSKTQTLQDHNSPITAVAFSQDGKYLAVYSSQAARITFYQTHQALFGIGTTQIRIAKQLPAPSDFVVVSPGGSYQPFRARLIWINTKSLTLMLPNGKENRFSV